MASIKKNKDVDAYVQSVSSDRIDAIDRLRNIFLKNLSPNLEECIQYKMISYVVPHKVFPAGYHCSPELPLPFISMASQKNFIAIYHMGLYANPILYNWFVNEYPKHCKSKLDMGKSCIRFKKMEDIPFTLIETLATKMSSKDWITTYSNLLKK
jgi:uncharacterized protein YdhG (YjbR/CyaY superfamily)